MEITFTCKDLYEAGELLAYLNSKMSQTTIPQPLVPQIPSQQSTAPVAQQSYAPITQQPNPPMAQQPIIPMQQPFAVPNTQVITPTQIASAPTVPQVTPVSAVPVAPTTYNLEQLSVAATALMDAGKMSALKELLAKYGVPAMTMLRPETYGAFATDLRALGAKI